MSLEDETRTQLRLERGEVAVLREDDERVFGAPFIEISVGGEDGRSVQLDDDDVRWLLTTALPAVVASRSHPGGGARG